MAHPDNWDVEGPPNTNDMPYTDKLIDDDDQSYRTDSNEVEMEFDDPIVTPRRKVFGLVISGLLVALLITSFLIAGNRYYTEEISPPTNTNQKH